MPCFFHYAEHLEKRSLFAGSIGAAKNLEALRREGVTHILNASPIVPCFHRQQFKYKVISIYDDAQEDISQFFEETSKFISKVNTCRDTSDSLCRIFCHSPTGFSIN